MIRYFLVCAIAIGALALDAAAQDDLGRIDVQGASLVGNHWGGVYLVKKCFGCSEPQAEDLAGPRLQMHLLRVYRADAEEGTITVSATMFADNPFRTQLGESVHQSITIVNPFNSGIQASDTGPPSQELQTQLDFDWSKDRYEARVLVDTRMGANVYFPGVELWLNGVFVVVKIQVQIIILPPQPSLVLVPAHAPARAGEPWLVDRLSLGYNYRVSAFGLHPFLQLDKLSFDGTALEEVPFEMVSEFAEKQLDPGTFMTRRNQPDGQPREMPSKVTDPGVWLYNAGDCCRPSQDAPFAFPNGDPLGSHRVTVWFEPINTDFMVSPSSDDVSPVTLETELIVFGPEVSLSSTALSPGRSVVATGTGFAPSSQVKVFAKVPYFVTTPPFERGEREIELGTAFTSLNGGFSERFLLPPGGDTFWSDLSGWNIDPPSPQHGILRFFIDDIDFHLNFDYLDSEESYCRVDVFPEGDATHECPIRTGVIAEVDFVKPSEAPAPPPLGGNSSPQDLDGDGLYEDVDGDGNPAFADAVLLAQFVAEPELTDHVAAFDFNGNERLDYADAVLLAQKNRHAQGASPAPAGDSQPGGTPGVTLVEAALALAPGEVVTVPFVLGEAVGGLSGFLLELALEGSGAEIADVRPIAFTGAKRVELAPDGRSARVLAVDFDSQVEPGAIAAPLVHVDLRGVDSGNATLLLWAVQMDDDAGYQILIDFEPMEITVDPKGTSAVISIINMLLLDK